MMTSSPHRSPSNKPLQRVPLTRRPLNDLTGFHSIRVNDQWRIVFRWRGSEAEDVSIQDYHRG